MEREETTDIGCPDCAGTLTGLRDDRDHVRFRCRVGHLYAGPELLAAKEHQIERHLWSAVAVLLELEELLRGLGCDPDRMHNAAEEAAAIREIIERADPVHLGKEMAAEARDLPVEEP
jgi:two-component system chemotaxis response regulator CheB